MPINNKLIRGVDMSDPKNLKEKGTLNGGGMSGSEPSTKIVPGSFGRKEGGFAKALLRKAEQEAIMKELDK
jgi:hypothetical protein